MNKNLPSKKDDISIVLCGEAGQGIQTVESILVHVFKRSNFHVFATKEYMSRVRGGSNSTTIRVSSKRISAYVDKIDILVPFHKGAVDQVKKRISDRTWVFADSKFIPEDSCAPACHFVDIPLRQLSEEIGGRIYLNVVAAGVVLGLFQIDTETIDEYLRRYFAGKEDAVIQKNLEAVRKGYDIGKDFRSDRLQVDVSPDPEVADEVLLNGAEAVGVGALAAGCNFLSSYPMSPSTGVMVFLSQQMKDFDVVVEQAEDEIAAVNMALGASYAGARSFVTTSGGGFALMGEGISLAGMIETPVVVHVAQRPGPATGLPTRTEQADLELVLHAGHGEFPRIIFAPGDIEQAITLTQKAFDLADRFQIPVFVLTDQYFMDTYYNTPSPDLSGIKADRHIVKTKKNYKRYALHPNGISPRGIPGYGEGLVGVDSDEHDEEAHITEDLELRSKMVDKRLHKMELIKKQAIPPEISGARDFKALLIGWGSTYPIIKEALSVLGRDDLAFCHFSQVFPLHEGVKTYLDRAEQALIIENNATSQLGRLIEHQTGVSIKSKILKYSGLPFSVEEIVEELRRRIKIGD
jgi:2-oxoglutarate ferredoxin oxidoreductase subunit alpha